MNKVLWLGPAHSYLVQELAQLKRAGYVDLQAGLGTIPLELPSELIGCGCRAIQTITEDERKWLTVTVEVVGPPPEEQFQGPLLGHIRIISRGCKDGFRVTPKGKVFPGYD